MGTYNWTGTAGADTINLAGFGQPSGGGVNIYNFDGGAGNDTFSTSTGNASYDKRFVSTGFTIGAADASGMIVVSGASTGGGRFTFNLKSVETLSFYDKSVTLSYGTPVTPTDTTPPTVSAYSPADGASGVNVGSDVVIAFSEAVQRGAGVIEIHSGSATGALVASYDASTSANLSVSGSTLTINPTANLVNGTHYFVTLTAGSIKDLAGNNYAGSAAYDFTTASASVDNTPPSVVSFSPATAATGVVISSDIVITFSEAVQRGTGTIDLHSDSATGAVVASYDASTSANLSVSGSTLTINPTADLASGTHYFVTLAAGSIQDSAGNSYAGTTAYDFTTAAVSPAVVPTTSLPADSSSFTGPALAGVGVLGILAWVLF